MKCLIFFGTPCFKAAEVYNKWAKGKVLAKDVIIHTHLMPPFDGTPECLMIVVFFDEKLHEDWIGKDPWKAAADKVMEERKAKELTVPA